MSITIENFQEYDKYLCIGIKYGYLQSSIGYYDRSKNYPTIEPDQSNNFSIPSCICIETHENKSIITYGHKMSIFNGNVLWGLSPVDEKDDWHQTYPKAQREHVPLDKITRSGTINRMIVQRVSEEDIFTKQEVTMLIIQQLVRMIKIHFRNPKIGKIGLLLPDDFIEQRKEELLLSCKFAGLKTENIEVMSSVSSSIVMYKRLNKEKVVIGNKIIVLDINERQMNIYCCEIVQKEEDCENVNDFYRVVSKISDLRLNSVRFDNILGELIMSKVNDALIKDKQQPVNFDDFLAVDQTADTQVMQEKIKAIQFLWNEINQSKKTFWEKSVVNVLPQHFVPSCEKKTTLHSTVNMSDFEEIVTKDGLIEKLMTNLRNVMKEAKFSRKNVNHFLFVGETSKIPLIVNSIKDMFPKKDKIYFSSDLKSYHPENVDIEGTIERAFHMRHTTKPIQTKLQSSIFIRVGMKDYQCLFSKGNELPLTAILATQLLPHERKKFFIEIASDSDGMTNGMANIKTIETVLLSVPKNIEEEMMKKRKRNEEERIKLQILIDDLGSIKIWFLKEDGTYDFETVKHVGNIGILNNDADRVNEKISKGFGTLDQDHIEKMLKKRK